MAFKERPRAVHAGEGGLLVRFCCFRCQRDGMLSGNQRVQLWRVAWPVPASHSRGPKTLKKAGFPAQRITPRHTTVAHIMVAYVAVI